MIGPTPFESGKMAPTPSGAIIPTYTSTRLRQIVTASFAKIRAGLLTLDAAQAEVEAAFDDFDVRQAAIAELRDAEVTLATEGKVRADARDTSTKAAATIAPKTGTQRGRVLAYVVEGNGSTDYEIARDLRLLPNSLRPRRNELVEAGYVIDSGETRIHRGSPWTIWQATDEARSWYLRQCGGAA